MLLAGLLSLGGCAQAALEPALPAPRQMENSILVPITPPPEVPRPRPAGVPADDEWEGLEMIRSPLPASTRPAAPGAKDVGVIKHFRFREGEVYTVPVSVQGPTYLLLPRGERLADKPVLNQELFEKVEVPMGEGVLRQEVVLIRALTPQSQGYTALMLQSGLMIFCRLVPAARPGVAAITWDLPAEPPPLPVLPIGSRPPRIDLSRVFTGYQVSVQGKHTPPWLPQQVFDDGSLTVLRFAEPLTYTRAPAVFGLHPDGKPGLVQSHMYVTPGHPERGAWLLVQGLWPALDLDDGHGLKLRITRQRGE